MAGSSTSFSATSLTLNLSTTSKITALTIDPFLLGRDSMSKRGRLRRPDPRRPVDDGLEAGVVAQRIPDRIRAQHGDGERRRHAEQELDLVEGVLIHPEQG